MAEDETDEAEPRVREGLEGDPVDEDDLGPEVPSHPDASTLESWWRAYLGLPEPRSPKRLARIVHANVHRVRRAVRTGWPDIGIASFESRLGDAEDQVARARAKAQIDGVVRGAHAVAELVVDHWATAARSHLEGLADVSAAIRQLAQNVAKASEGASFVQYRSVPDIGPDNQIRRDAKGKPILVLKPYVSGNAVALATARLAQAAKDHAVLNKALLDSLNPMRDAAIDLSDAPPEALEYIRRKFG